MKRLRITVEGKTYEVEVEMVDDDGQPMAMPAAKSTRRSSARRSASAAPAAPAPSSSGKLASTPTGEGDVGSPLSAVVVSVDVTVGQEVSEGDKLVTLEAMKMNTMVNAPHGGKITAIEVAAGDAVEEGQVLVTIG